MQNLFEADVEKKRVLLLLDLNVPMENTPKGKIVASDYRIQAVLPTLKYLLSKKASILIMSHLGQPHGHFMEEMSLKPVARYLSYLLKKPIVCTDEILTPGAKTLAQKTKPGEIFMFGNLRFTPEEEKNNNQFAKELASFGNVFVNDAFSVSHRVHASVVQLPTFLSSYAGVRFQKEIETLTELLLDPPKPLTVLLGGAKLEDKIDTLKHILPIADYVILGGAVANTFLKAAGEEVSSSLIDPNKIDLAQELMENFPHKIMLPVDWMVDYPKVSQFRILDIGPITISKIKDIAQQSATIFWNGDFGFVEDSRFRKGTETIINYLAGTNKRTIISGGDTVAVLEKMNKLTEVTFVSTGGGATLKFLAGKELPGIVALDSALQYKYK